MEYYNYVGGGMKAHKYTKYVLVECNLFLRSPGKMKGCLVLIYIQVNLYMCEEIKKY